MKKTLIGLLIVSAITVYAVVGVVHTYTYQSFLAGDSLTITPISLYPKTTIVSDNWVFVTSDPTQGNYGICASNLVGAITTGVFPSMTNSLTINNARWILQATSDCAVTNVIPQGSCANSLLVISNATSGNIVFHWLAAGNAIGPVTTNAMTIPAGKFGYVSVDYYYGCWTNYVTAVQQ